MHKVLAAILLVVWTVSSPVEAYGETYTNMTFRFSVDVPAGLRICKSDDSTTDHGIVILMSADQSCNRDSFEAGPAIGIYAGFNAPFLARSTEELAQATCGQQLQDARSLDLRQASDQLLISGKNTFACTFNKPNGNIDIKLVTLVADPATAVASWIAIHHN